MTAVWHTPVEGSEPDLGGSNPPDAVISPEWCDLAWCTANASGGDGRGALRLAIDRHGRVHADQADGRGQPLSGTSPMADPSNRRSRRVRAAARVATGHQHGHAHRRAECRSGLDAKRRHRRCCLAGLTGRRLLDCDRRSRSRGMHVGAGLYALLLS